MNVSKNRNQTGDDIIAKRRAALDIVDKKDKNKFKEFMKEFGIALISDPDFMINTGTLLFELCGYCSSSNSLTKNYNTNGPANNLTKNNNIKCVSTPVSVGEVKHINRTSPVKHTVSSYTRIQNGKIVHVSSYTRGGRLK